MPCRYDPTPEEISAPYKERATSYKKKLDKLTAENDKLREAIVSVLESTDWNISDLISEDVLKVVRSDQIKHRKEDLKRLEKEIKEAIKLANDTMSEENAAAACSIFYSDLGKVVAADPEHALESQLGFDPDTY